MSIVHLDAAGAADSGARAGIAGPNTDDGDRAADQTERNGEVLQDDADALQEGGASSRVGLYKLRSALFVGLCNAPANRDGAGAASGRRRVVASNDGGWRGGRKKGQSESSEGEDAREHCAVTERAQLCCAEDLSEVRYAFYT